MLRAAQPHVKPFAPVPSGHDETAAPPEGEAAVSPYVLPYYGAMLLLELFPQQGEVDDGLRHQRVVDHPVPIGRSQLHEGVAAQLAERP
jgi:hypothetical protein